jgi:predicted transcriptional regulator
MQTQIKPIAIKLPEQDRERLKKIGEAKKRSVHWLAKEAITQFIEREEGAERFRRETLAAWEEYSQTGKSVANDDVMAWLDSWETDDERKAPL